MSTKQALQSSQTKTKKSYMAKMWTLSQALGEKAKTFLLKMHSRYGQKLPLLHSWPMASAAFRTMPKMAQLDVLVQFFDMYEAGQKLRKIEVKEEREQAVSEEREMDAKVVDSIHKKHSLHATGCPLILFITHL